MADYSLKDRVKENRDALGSWTTGKVLTLLIILAIATSILSSGLEEKASGGLVGCKTSVPG